MIAPETRMAIAKDGETQVRFQTFDDGTVSIRLTSGAMSCVAALDRDIFTFLAMRAEADAA